MRKISIDSVRPGMVLAKAIFGDRGQNLLNSGVEIKPQYITYLKQLGLNQIYVQDSRMEDVEVKDIIEDETRREAHSLITNIMNDQHLSTSKKKGLNIKDDELMKTVSQIVEELLDNKDMMAQLQDIGTLNYYLFSHSVNCCVLATLVGTKMGYNKKILNYLATGALLHDLEMSAIPKNILNKEDTLTKEEFETVKNHPTYGYEIFKNTKLFTASAGAVIMQHHERYQGQGYPRGLKGNSISPLAQAAGIADVYDALTSERPYRSAYQPHEAIEMLMGQGDNNFDLSILNHFLSCVAAYPIGTHVLLSNKESGLVIANTQGLTLRPVVRVLYTGEDLAPHPKPYDLDLSRFLDLTVIRVLD